MTTTRRYSSCFNRSHSGSRDILVFGSNLAGRHESGTALYAQKLWGAEYGVGFGLAGNSYAIPTKGFSLETLPLTLIKSHVLTFLRFTNSNPELTFLVTAIGTGLAGYDHEDIAPMFEDSPLNCVLPVEWKVIYEAKIL